MGTLNGIVKAKGVFLSEDRIDTFNRAQSLMTTAFGAWQGILSRIDEIALHSKAIPHGQVNTRLSELKIKLTELAVSYKKVLIEVNKSFAVNDGYIEYVDTWQEAYENGIDIAIKENDCAVLLELTRDFPINTTFASYMEKKNADGRPAEKSPLKKWMCNRWSELESKNPTAKPTAIREMFLLTFASPEQSERGIKTGNWIPMDGAGDMEREALKDLMSVTARKHAGKYRDNLFR